MSQSCTHLNQIHKVHPSGKGCKECLEMGDTWVHLAAVPDLRACRLLRLLEEQARHQAFITAEHHPIIQSFEPGEDWRWCYVDEMFLE